MATKKQKREAAEAKRQARLDEMRQSGLEAQRKDREHRAKEERKAWRKQHDEKHSWKKRIVECPLCRDILKAQKKNQLDGSEPVAI